MPHYTPLIATVVVSLTIAFVLGVIAQRLRVSALVAYLLAGIIVGPFTPGYVADQALASELAEIGVILLMFGVGLHFSLKDLLAVRAIAIPGALGQMAVATLLGMGLAYAVGWPPAAGFVFGLALSVASTVVLLRALQERHILQTDRGRIAVGWLIVEDLAMVLALVIIPAVAGLLAPGDALSGSANPWDTWLLPLAATVARVSAFVAFMLIIGRRVIPWVLHYVAHTGSRELFRLAVFSIALGVAFGAALLFDVSFALGAFFAGMVLAESELSQRAAQETLPLRDAFAVLFFVSVGMLFNPSVIIADPWPLLATVAIILVGKSMAALTIVRLFRHDMNSALTIAASLAQIGEFSFILAELGVEQGLLPERARDLILGGAIISIVLNPLLFAVLSRTEAGRTSTAGKAPTPARDIQPTSLTDHSIVIGFGRVGSVVIGGLKNADYPLLVVETDEAGQRRAVEAGVEVIGGNGADPQILAAAGIGSARRLIIAIPDGFEAGGIVEEARGANPDIAIIARAHSDAEVEHLVRLGADQTILGEQEIARAILNLIRPPTPPASGLRAHSGDTALPAIVPAHLMFSDPEWALLAAIRSRNITPGNAFSKAELMRLARQLENLSDARLMQGIEWLKEKACLTEIDEMTVSVTATGYAASMSARPALP